MSARVVTIVVGRMRYTAAFERVDGHVHLTTGTARVSREVGDDSDEVAAKEALRQLVEANPATPGVALIYGGD